MATQPTNLPVPSESPRDLKFNAGKINEFVTSLQREYEDRFGNKHYTIEGLRWFAQQAIAQFGWISVGTFQTGATLSTPNQILKDTTDGEYYRWDGIFPKVVPSGLTPSSSGGVGTGAWLSVDDSTLRATLASPAGASNIGETGGEVGVHLLDNGNVVAHSRAYATSDGEGVQKIYISYSAFDQWEFLSSVVTSDVKGDLVQLSNGYDNNQLWALTCANGRSDSSVGRTDYRVWLSRDLKTWDKSPITGINTDSVGYISSTGDDDGNGIT